MTRRRARIESLGLVPIATLRSKEGPGRFVFHARPTDRDGRPA